MKLRYKGVSKSGKIHYQGREKGLQIDAYLSDSEEVEKSEIYIYTKEVNSIDDLKNEINNLKKMLYDSGKN